MCLSHLNFTNLTEQRNVFFPQYYTHADFQYRKAKHTVFYHFVVISQTFFNYMFICIYSWNSYNSFTLGLAVFIKDNFRIFGPLMLIVAKFHH